MSQKEDSTESSFCEDSTGGEGAEPTPKKVSDLHGLSKKCLNKCTTINRFRDNMKGRLEV